MNIIIAIFILLNILISKNAQPNDVTNDLKNRLDKVNSFHANFIQKIIDSNGNVIQESQGDLWAKRPNLFNWHIIQPDENILVSDGKVLWLYNPPMKQVIATCTEDIVSNTPFIFITRNTLIDLKKYNISRDGDNFLLIPKNKNINFKKLTIKVSRDGTIYQFNITEQDNLNKNYELKLKKNSINKVNASKFIFIPPKGVTIDDQCNKSFR